MKNIYLGASTLYSYVMFKFLPTDECTWRDPKYFDFNKYSCNSQKSCVLAVDLDYPIELCKFDQKNKMLPNYQLKVADLHNVSIGYVKKLVSNFFDKENYVLYYENLQLYLRLGLKFKKYIVNKNSIFHNI